MSYAEWKMLQSRLMHAGGGIFVVCCVSLLLVKLASVQVILIKYWTWIWTIFSRVPKRIYGLCELYTHFIHSNHEAHSQRSVTWWRHQMKTFSVLLALCEGNSPVTGGFLSQRSATSNIDNFFDLCTKKRLNKQPRRRWFETQSLIMTSL